MCFYKSFEREKRKILRNAAFFHFLTWCPSCRKNRKWGGGAREQGESHMGRHSWSVGGHCLSPPDAPALSLWFGGATVLRIEKGRRTPIFIIRSQVPQKMPSWKGARAQPPMPAARCCQLLGTQAKPETSLGSLLRRHGWRGKSNTLFWFFVKNSQALAKGQSRFQKGH